MHQRLGNPELLGTLDHRWRIFASDDSRFDAGQVPQSLHSHPVTDVEAFQFLARC
jgi:hypothetical protein